MPEATQAFVFGKRAERVVAEEGCWMFVQVMRSRTFCEPRFLLIAGYLQPYSFSLRQFHLVTDGTLHKSFLSMNFDNMLTNQIVASAFKCWFSLRLNMHSDCFQAFSNWPDTTIDLIIFFIIKLQYCKIEK